MTNEKLGQLFNMSCSAGSHSVTILKEKMSDDKKVVPRCFKWVSLDLPTAKMIFLFSL